METCRYCGQTNLAWERTWRSDQGAAYRLVSAITGALHFCQEYLAVSV